MLVSASPLSPHKSGDLRAKAPSSSCLSPLRSVAQGLQGSTSQLINTDLVAFQMRQTTILRELKVGGKRLVSKHSPVLECAAGERGGVASVVDAGVGDSQSLVRAVKEALAWCRGHKGTLPLVALLSGPATPGSLDRRDSGHSHCRRLALPR